MSASQSPLPTTSEDDIPRTIIYDPTDPFWNDTEDDDDDMDYMPAPGDSQDEDDEDADLSFHGGYHALPINKDMRYSSLPSFIDAAENLSGVEIEVEFTDDNEIEGQYEEGGEGNEEEGEGQASSSGNPNPRPIYSALLSISYTTH